MTTKKQIGSLLSRIAERHDDLAVFGRFIVLRPLRHVLRSISIDRSWDKDYPRFYWHVGHAFTPYGMRQGLCLEEFWLPRGSPDRWSQPGFAEAATDTIEQQILPMLRRVQSIDDMFHVEGVPRSPEYDDNLRYEPYQLHIHAACGRLDEAVAIYERIKDWHLELKPGRFQFEFSKASELGALAAAGDRPAVAALLHQWEDEFVARTELGAIYERTPFPIEQL